MQTHPNSPNPRTPMNVPPTLDNLTAQTGAYFLNGDSSSSPPVPPSNHESQPALVSNINTQAQDVVNTTTDTLTTPIPEHTPFSALHHTKTTSISSADTQPAIKPQPAINKRPLMHTPWARMILSSSVLYTSFLLYNRLYIGEFIWAGASEALAGTAAVLIGLSFALSGLTYFFDFADHYLKYRKQLGQLGFLLAFVYALSLVVRYPELYGWGLPARLSHPEVLLGLAAMEYFFFMILISTPKGMKMVGSWWRPLLRTGYLAYGCLIIRAIILEKGIWLIWWGSLASLPPPRLVITIFALMVICLRLALQVTLWRKQLYS